MKQMRMYDVAYDPEDLMKDCEQARRRAWVRGHLQEIEYAKELLMERRP